MDHRELRCSEAVVDEEAVGPDFPECLAAGEPRQQLRLRVGQTKKLPGMLDLRSRLAIDNARFGVGKEPFARRT
jgi:hypothetical protein